MGKLMQGGIRDFSISTLKKHIIVGCHLKIDNQGHSVDKERYKMGERHTLMCRL